MKCPFRFVVGQVNIYKPVTDAENNPKGDCRLFIENQEYAECYQENCVAWDNEKKRCRKVGGE